MSHNLRSLKVVTKGTTIGVIKPDTRSSDYGSNDVAARPLMSSLNLSKSALSSSRRLILAFRCADAG